MTIIDLSRTLSPSSTVYPGDEPIELTQSRFISTDGYSDHRLETSMHIGTHIDAPLHILENGQSADSISLENLCGRGLLIDVRGSGIIHPGDALLNIDAGDIVLFMTGASALYGTDSYYSNHPVLSEEIADLLISRRVKLVGFDSPSPDMPPFHIHKKLLTAGILIAENLCNLESLIDLAEFEIFAIPMKIRADAAPARIFALSGAGNHP